MKTIEIERKSSLSREDFSRNHLSGEGLPVIVTDAMDAWPARRNWNLAHLRERFGGDLVPVSLGLMSSVAKMTKLSAFIDHLERPQQDLPGFWVNYRDGRPLAEDPPAGSQAYYLTSWYAFQKHPELMEDIQPAPYFVSDWELALDARMREAFQWVSGRETTSLYVSAPGALSPLHRDFWNTHAWLGQIQGRKQAWLFAPKDSEMLYDGRVNPEQPDTDAFPLFDRATAYTATIAPGDMLFMPAGWWHHVRSLDNSITVSHNFFNETNVNDHLAGVLRNLPRLAEGLERNPQWTMGR